MYETNAKANRPIFLKKANATEVSTAPPRHPQSILRPRIQLMARTTSKTNRRTRRMTTPAGRHFLKHIATAAMVSIQGIHRATARVHGWSRIWYRLIAHENSIGSHSLDTPAKRKNPASPRGMKTRRNVLNGCALHAEGIPNPLRASICWKCQVLLSISGRQRGSTRIHLHRNRLQSYLPDTIASILPPGRARSCPPSG